MGIPSDAWDWDAMQIPAMVDAEWPGHPRKLLCWAHRNGVFYVLHRTNGKFLPGKPFVKLDGKQYVAVAARHGMFVFGLRE
jgi:alcohol dehydrogenase (cytochrome c)